MRKPGEQEEQVDGEERAVGPGVVQVVGDDGEEGEGPQAVERRRGRGTAPAVAGGGASSSAACRVSVTDPLPAPPPRMARERYVVSGAEHLVGPAEQLGGEQRPAHEQALARAAGPGRWRSIHSSSPQGGSTSRASGSSAATCSDVAAGVVGVARAAAEHERRDVEGAGVGVGQARDELVAAGAVGDHPALHGGDELRAGPGRGTAAGCAGFRSSTSAHSGRAATASMPPVQAARMRAAAVVGAEDHEAVDAAADPPQRPRPRPPRGGGRR